MGFSELRHLSKKIVKLGMSGFRCQPETNLFNISKNETQQEKMLNNFKNEREQEIDLLHQDGIEKLL